MEFTGDDARRFHEYMEDPDCTACGLILIYEAHLMVYPDSNETKRKLAILKTRDPDETIFISHHREIFYGDDVRQRYFTIPLNVIKSNK